MTSSKPADNTELLNQILKEMRELKSEIADIKEELSTQPTIKDLEVFKAIDELEAKDYFISEKEFAKKHGFKI